MRVPLEFFVLSAFGTLAAAVSPSCAHDSLYHYIEIGPGAGEGAVEVSFSIHAADFPIARTMGADPAGSDLAWLRGRSRVEIETLLAEAAAFIATNFALVAGVEEIALSARKLVFPEPALLSENPAAAEAARPGFLIATLVLPAGAGEITVRHAPTSGKRLLLVLNRPGAFPLVRDLAPGQSETIPLQTTKP